MGPALMVNPFVWEYYYGIAGTGTPARATKQIATMAEDLIEKGTAANVPMNSAGKPAVNIVRCLEGCRRILKAASSLPILRAAVWRAPSKPPFTDISSGQDFLPRFSRYKAGPHKWL